jgi:hypothetical protein
MSLLLSTVKISSPGKLIIEPSEGFFSLESPSSYPARKLCLLPVHFLGEAHAQLKNSAELFWQTISTLLN